MVGTVDVDAGTAFRHQHTPLLSEHCEHLLGGDLCITTSRNDFQAAYDVSARLPFVKFRDNMALAL
jgi:hypothetical protein